RQDLVHALLRRVRYLLTLKGRPPFRLAGIEMFERLHELVNCLEAFLAHAGDERLFQLQQGLRQALQSLTPEYNNLRQVANWLADLSELLDPEDKPLRTGQQVRDQIKAYLDSIVEQNRDNPSLAEFANHIYKTTSSYESGLFHTYDVPGLPRTNNDRESEFRDLNRRLLITTGQKGATRRILQRSGAWELLIRPDSLTETVSALSEVDPNDFRKEQNRVATHRDRFKLHTRSVKQAHKQLLKLYELWLQLPQDISSG
ncbi:MAG: hypothetical protein L0Y56_22630, partial [Nitrospira sp.]|nr:hypothetical protein [Nitrospira sp.]